MPVALKAQSHDLPHKSDAGGVELGLADALSIARAWERIHANIARHRPGLTLDGVLVERMSPGGVELIIRRAQRSRVGSYPPGRVRRRAS